MPSIVLIEKTGVAKSLAVKDYDEPTLYKRAGFKSADGFTKHTVYSLPEGYTVSLYGKTTGRAGQENKYDFPPPADNTLFFGTVALVSANKDGEIVSMTAPDWQKVYEHLFGGFEDLDNTDDDEEMDTEEELEQLGPNVKTTKQGYIKDDFVVDDDDVDAGDEASSDEEYVPKSKAKPKKRHAKAEAKAETNTKKKETKESKEPKAKKETNTKSKKQSASSDIVSQALVSAGVQPADEPPENIYAGCNGELEEEAYVQ